MRLSEGCRFGSYVSPSSLTDVLASLDDLLFTLTGHKRFPEAAISLNIAFFDPVPLFSRLSSRSRFIGASASLYHLEEH
jgi:hypothetical protein